MNGHYSSMPAPLRVKNWISNFFRLELVTGDTDNERRVFGNVQKCFGTLISTKHVLTRDNCVYHEGDGLITNIKDVLISKVISIYTNKTFVRLISRPFRNKTGVPIQPSRSKRNLRKSE